MKTIIYYFTGTGNSLYIAKEVSEYLGDCELAPIVKALREDNINCQYEKVGIVFPIYYGGLPKIVAEFINRLELKKNAYVFAIGTKGGSEGIPMKQIDKALKKSNNRLRFSYYVTMPDSYIKMYNVKDDEYNKTLIDKEKHKLFKQLELVKKNEENSISKSFLYYAIKPIYKSFMKKVNFKDQEIILNGTCTKCGLCQKVCPVDNIYLVNGLPSWKHECQQCMACVQSCPQKVINIGKKTINKRRYINPYVNIKELINQKN